MYAIRVKKNQLRMQVIDPLNCWVEDGNGLYVDKSQRTIFVTREEAQEAIAESWEEIVKVDD